MITLYLIRHGETVWNIESKTQGCVDIDLTLKGLEQAKLIAEKLKKNNKKVLSIYTSDLKRCYKTAEIIGERLNVETIPLTELREMDFGLWEGLTIGEIKRKYPKEYYLWRKQPSKTYIPNGENLKSVKKRCIAVIHNIVKNYHNGNIIIVSHTVAIKVIILSLLGIDLSHYYNITQNNACINTLELRDYGPVLTSLNDINHLNNLVFECSQGGSQDG